MEVRLRWLWLLGLLTVVGCLFPVREEVDTTVCDLAAHPPDLVPPPDSSRKKMTEILHPPEESSVKQVAFKPVDTLPPPAGPKNELLTAQAPADKAAEKKGAEKFLQRLQVPAGLPGGEAAPIELPDKEKRLDYYDKLYPVLPALGPGPAEQPGPEGRPLTLTDLQRLAMSNSPNLRQATADVTATRGAAIQAGLPKNPNFGFEDDTMGTAGGPGYLGGFIEQVISTAGKLKLAEAAAGMDYFNAQVALRRARFDLAGQVRAGYFAVLVARENMRVSELLYEFIDRLYRIHVDKVKSGVDTAPYEPMQLRVLVMQARGNLVQARNRYTSAWKQLAATLGLPGLPPTELDGRVDIPVPVFRHDQVLARILSNHTDVLAAENTIRKARYNLRLAQVTPIPDVDVRVMLQRDLTGPPFEMSPSVMMSVPIPVWDRNQGGIMQSQAQLMRAVEESHRVRNDLTSRAADAFERYENNRVLLEYYRDHILPDQVRAYRGIYERHQIEKEIVGFVDIVNAQQTLATAVTTYITTLGAQWTAVVDLSTLLQTDNLFGGELSDNICAVPDMNQLLALPCGHPCSPLQSPELKAGNAAWPAAVPEAKPK
jgi:cobalt-zinc-cadmium efflux system outer membrane protein